MGNVIYDMSASLDGFVTAANRTPEEPLGVGGERLHEWAFADMADHESLGAAVASLGAIITGRTNYDDSVPWWGADGPTGATRLPVFVVTHQPPARSPENGVYTFVTDGIEEALRQARAAARDKDVAIMGGPTLGNQYLAAGLVDEIGIHQVPVLFGTGTRMFADIDSKHTELELVETIHTPNALHLRYRVRR